MEQQSFNLMPVMIALGQAVPVWLIVGWIANAYNKKQREAQDTLNNRFQSMDQRLQAMEIDIKQIQLSLAGASLDNLEREMESLKESKAQHKIQIEAIWRTLDDLRANKAARRDYET